MDPGQETSRSRTKTRFAAAHILIIIAFFMNMLDSYVAVYRVHIHFELIMAWTKIIECNPK